MTQSKSNVSQIAWYISSHLGTMRGTLGSVRAAHPGCTWWWRSGSYGEQVCSPCIARTQAGPRPTQMGPTRATRPLPTYFQLLGMGCTRPEYGDHLRTSPSVFFLMYLGPLSTKTAKKSDPIKKMILPGCFSVVRGQFWLKIDEIFNFT